MMNHTLLLILGFLAATSSTPAHALFKSTEISQIIVEKHSPQSNMHLEIETTKGKQIIDLGQYSNEENRRFNPPLKIKRIRFHVSTAAQANAKAGSSLQATLNGKALFKGGDRYKIKMEPVVVGRTQFKKKLISCTPLLYVSPHMGRLLIELKDDQGLAACKIKDSENLNLDEIGRRDLGGDKGNFYTREQDSVLGAQYANEFISQNRHIVFDRHHPTTLYAQGLMNRIAAASDMPHLQPSVHVINADVLNAFALPGGHVFVFRGLIDRAQSEAQVAGVLGHEWAHVTTRHGTRGMSRSIKIMLGAYATFIAVGVAGNNSKSEVIQQLTPLFQYATLIGGQVLVMKFSKDQEREADKLGAQYAWRAGFAPTGIGEMFEVFSKADPSGSSGNFLETAFRSHPFHEERIVTNYLYASRYPGIVNPAGNEIAFQQARDAMKSIPSLSSEDSKQVMNAFKDSLAAFSETEVKLKVAELAPKSD